MTVTSKIQHFSKNTRGRDFAVGDIHGCFSKLQAALDGLDFNEAQDRLFSVGDLVDRGPESECVLDWLEKPWFYAVRGNHEQMAIDFFEGQFSEPFMTDAYLRLGGAWFANLPHESARIYAETFRLLPIALEVEADCGLIGIVHADCPNSDWAFLAAALQNQDASSIEYCLSNRTRLQRGYTQSIKGLTKLYVGHTPVEQPVRLGNVMHIDTGAVFDRPFCIEQFQ